MKGWLKLTPEQQASCISRLRYGSPTIESTPSHLQLCLANTNPSDLVRERDENVQSTAVDAIELKDRLE